MAIDSDRPEMDAPPPPPPPPLPPEFGSYKDAFNAAAQPLPGPEKVREPEQEEVASDLALPRAANDDVAGTKYDQSEGTPVIGRLDDTGVAREWEGHTVIDLRANPNANEVWAEAHERGDLRPDGRPVTEPGWSPELNEDWIGSIAENRAIVYLGSEPAGDDLVSGDHRYPSVFSTEVGRLQDAGYQRVGDYLVPEELAQVEFGSYKDAFNAAAQPLPKAETERGGDAGEGTKGSDGTEETTPELAPDPDGGQDAVEESEADEAEAGKAAQDEADDEAAKPKADVDAEDAEATRPRAAFNRVAVKAAEADATDPPPRPHQAPKGPKP